MSVRRRSMSAGRRSLRFAGTGLAAMLALATVSVQAQAQDKEHAAGRAVYQKWCAPCHDPGIEHPGTHALETKYAGVKSGVLLEMHDLQPAVVRQMVRHGVSVMPQFRKTEISDADLAALVAYLTRNTHNGS